MSERCGHLDRAIAEGARDGERFLTKFERCIVVADDPTLVHHQGCDSPEPVLLAERPCEHLRFLEVISDVIPIAESAFRTSIRMSMSSWLLRRVSGR
jgi:hypothetical protein